MRSFFFAMLPAVISIAVCATAHAQTPPRHREHVRFSYEAPAGCPNADQFVAMVRERDAELIADDEAARSLSVTFGVQEKWHGTLRSEGIASGEATRTITGDSCDAVAHSIAIFTAIALREGSPDELPPAHPDAAPADIGEPNQTAGFMPMAPPPTILPLEKDLHRKRFALTAKESLSVMSDGGRSAGTGLAATYFFNKWLGVDAQGDLLFNLKPSVDDPYVNDVRARVETHAEFETLHAWGTFSGPDRGNPVDLFLKPGFGFIWTRPRNYWEPENPSYSYAPRLLFDLSIGTRYFVTDSFAISIEADGLLYNEPGDPEPPPTIVTQFAGGNNTPTSSLNEGLAFQLGFTWFPSSARKWAR